MTHNPRPIIEWLNELPELIRELVKADFVCNAWCFENDANCLSSAIMGFSWDLSVMGSAFYVAIHADALYHERNNIKLPR